MAFTLSRPRRAACPRLLRERTGLRAGSVGNHGDTYGVEYDLPGGCLALTHFIEDPPSATARGTIAFEVEDIDALTRPLQDRGVPFRSDVIHGPVRRMTVCEERGPFEPAAPAQAQGVNRRGVQYFRFSSATWVRLASYSSWNSSSVKSSEA